MDDDDEKMYLSTCLQGAPEGLLDRCQFVRVGTQKIPITPGIKAEITKHVKFYGTGERGFAVLWLLCWHCMRQQHRYYRITLYVQ